MDSIAIIGYSFKLPGAAEDDASLWDMLEHGRNVMTPWPKSRTNVDAFYDPESSRPNTLHHKGAHFVDGDLTAFDAPFFAMSSREATSMDPQQRWLLEASYRAFENAGIPAEKVAGTETSVFAASMGTDFMNIVSKDADTAPVNTATGTTASFLASRLSWYFDLKGPSMQVNTACSTSMIAIDLACQSLRSNQCSMSLVAGANILIDAECSMFLNNMGFLSPDSLCYSFDERANGYARGEGVIVVLLKRLPDAIRDGDTIRAVIRGTDTNQDGHTPGITMPSASSQEALIRKVYKTNGLSFDQTRYIEAHGTGTQIGDTIETSAVGRVFRHSRSPEEPLYVGSIKANVGHLEGGSGLAGIIKGILMLEKGLIPPNANFEKLNPKINAKLYNIKIPTSLVPWPSKGLRRIGINSFGFGGSNGHVIMDDAYHVLESLGQKANHHTIVDVPSPATNGNGHVNGDEPAAEAVTNGNGHEATNGHAEATETATNGNGHEAVNGHAEVAETATNGNGHEAVNGHAATAAPDIQPSDLKLLVWSAKDEAALKRVLQQYSKHYEVAGLDQDLETLAYTLSQRRSIMSWKSFTVTNSKAGPAAISKSVSSSTRSSRQSTLAFVFTGQGAQYAKMGLELIQYPIFKSTLEQIGRIFTQLGAEWSLFDKLQSKDEISKPQYSQPLCTALQIALIELLESFNITPSAVVGHSSGEIASAYCAGALSLESACKVAYHRGRLAGQLVANLSATPGAMMSANLQEDEVEEYLSKVPLKSTVHIACVNSPTNVTLSGDEADIDILKEYLDESSIFAQKLKTGVAYHSPAMQSIAEEYLQSLGDLQEGDARRGDILIVSSVTGQKEARSQFTEASYWVENLTSQVRFSDALQYIAVAAPEADGLASITDYLEVGPHAALKRPVSDTLTPVDNKKGWKYSSLLSRLESPVKCVLESVGRLFSQGFPVSVLAANQQQDLPQPVPFLTNTPQYPFDHSQTYWHESRISRQWRQREATKGSLIGFRSADWNPLEPRWRKILSVEEMPWLADHVVEETIYLPATGSLVMALEAVNEMDERPKAISGYRIKDATFKAPIVIPADEGKAEVVTQLRRLQLAHTKATPRYEVKLFTCADDYWNECLSVTIFVEYKDVAPNEVDGGQEAVIAAEALARTFSNADELCKDTIETETFYNWHKEQGLKYGDAFLLADHLRWNGEDLAMSTVDVAPPAEPYKGIFHPAVLDASCQMCFISPSQGMVKKLPTIIPHKISSAWLSATGWQYPDTNRIRTMAKSKVKSTSMGVEASFIVVGDDGKPLCHVEHVDMHPVKGEDEAASTDVPKLLHGIDWKPQLSLLKPDQLQKFCNVDHFDDDETEAAKYCIRLKNVCLAAMKFHMKEMQETDWSKAPSHMKQFVAWMERELGRNTVETLTAEELAKELDVVREMRPAARMFIEIAEKLASIVSGETDIVGLLFTTSLAQDLYDTLFERMDNPKLESYVQLLAHEVPEQKILEVGAGTGGMTSVLLSYLDRIEERTGGTAFSEYAYSDISTGFFDKALKRFAKFQDRMTFKTFDLEKDPLTQGWQARSYDVIFAGSVIHATRNLNNTIQNLQKLLKPGGKLIMHETTAEECFQISFGFGPLSGWWLSEEDYRPWGPIITVPEWDRVLKENGFSGNDMVIKDFQSDDAYWGSMIMTTLGQPAGSELQDTEILLVVDEEDSYKVNLASLIVENWATNGRGYKPKTVSLGQLDETTLSSTKYEHVVFLGEEGSSYLANLSEAAFGKLRAFINASKNILWVSTVDGSDPSVSAYAGLKDGFLRTLRSEYQGKRIVSLTLPDTPLPESSAADKIVSVFASAFDLLSPEDEYLVKDDLVLTGRVIQEVALNQNMGSSVVPQIKQESWLPGPPLKVDVLKRGSIDTLSFVEDPEYYEPLKPKEVEVEAKAWSVNFRDIFLALGRLEDAEGMGSDCAGIVSRVGSEVTAFKPGDRVIMGSTGCMKMFARDEEGCITMMPDSLSFEGACSILNGGSTSYYALVEVARLQKGEKILIHAGSGATGQLAIQIAQMVGAEVFTTVGYDHKKRLLMDEYHIPEDHIFYSRDTSFAKGVKRVTNGYGVDVVLNSLAGDGLIASWECIAPHGRFIEIGKSDIHNNSSLPMAYFAKNVTFSAVDLRHVAQCRKDISAKLLPGLMVLAEQGKVYPCKPTVTYGLEEIHEAFRLLQSGKNTGRIVVKIDPAAKVEKHLINRRLWTFPENATYLIAGGLGGIGRSILTWMASKGAKNLVVPTRSGASSEAAAETVKALTEQGVNILTPKCDVTSKESLSQLLEEVKTTMPPIRGCINAVMVLQDSVYENMTHAQWDTAVRSKVGSSVNLHNLLGDGLDFFILLSSGAGIVGNISQSNYATGSTFQDALARYRVSKGQRATAIDLGLMRTIGIVAETETLQRNFERSIGLAQIEEDEFLTLMDICCNPVESHTEKKSQMTVGLITPADMLAAGVEVAEMLQRPLFSYFSRPRGLASSGNVADTVNFAALFRQATSAEERAGIVTEALATKLARALSMKVEDIETDQPIYSYGVDSLVAIELRNWISKEFGADVPVFEIIGGKSVSALGDLVTKSTHVTKKAA